MKRIETTTKIMNKYHATVIDSRTGAVKQELKFHNTVSDWWKTNVAPVFGAYRDIYLGLGIGTSETPHTAADTELYERIYGTSFNTGNQLLKHEANSPVVSFNATINLSETEAVGSLTEIGLFANNGYNQPFCMASFQDGEGHIISIDKTKYDTLTIEISLEVTLDLSDLASNVVIPWTGFFQGSYSFRNPFPVPVKHTKPILGEEKTEYLEQGWTNAFTKPNWVSWATSFGINSGLITLSPNKNVFSGNDKTISKPVTYSRLTVEGEVINRFSVSDLALSADYNLSDDRPWQIMSMWLRYGGTMVGINLPDYDIFPPTKLEFELVGDGITTDFNLPVPVLMASSETYPVIVTIDNSSLPSTEYDWYGINWDTVQPWECTDGRWMDDVSVYEQSYTMDRHCPTFPYNRSTTNYFGETIVYDFGEPITVDYVVRLKGEGLGSLYYIDDSGNQVLAKRFVSGEAGKVRLDQGITAQKWVAENSIDWGATSQQTTAILFGDYENHSKPTIHFHTAPGIDQIIHIEAYTEYPCKNSDWIFDNVSFDIIKKASE